MRMSKTNLSLACAAGTLALTLGAASSAQAEGKSLTMCWAAWDPANALVELDKDFTKATGIEMKHEFVPNTLCVSIGEGRKFYAKVLSSEMVAVRPKTLPALPRSYLILMVSTWAPATT